MKLVIGVVRKVSLNSRKVRFEFAMGSVHYLYVNRCCKVIRYSKVPSASPYEDHQYLCHSSKKCFSLGNITNNITGKNIAVVWGMNHGQLNEHS